MIAKPSDLKRVLPTASPIIPAHCMACPRRRSFCEGRTNGGLEGGERACHIGLLDGQLDSGKHTTVGTLVCGIRYLVCVNADHGLLENQTLMVDRGTLTMMITFGAPTSVPR